MKLAIRLGLAGTVALAAALVAASVGGDRGDVAENREQIVAKTDAQRDELRREWGAYGRMPDAERNAVRRLHEEVSKDQRLTQTLHEYEKFLAGLGPWEREELREIAEPAKRVARVRQIVEERRPPRSFGKPAWLTGRFDGGEVLPPPQFDEAMRQVAAALGLPDEKRAELLKTEPSHVRNLEIARLAAAKAEETAKRATKSDGGPLAVAWPDEKTVEYVINLLPAGFLKEMVSREDFPGPWRFGDPKWEKATRDDRRREARRSFMLGLLMRSLVAEWQTVAVRVIPTDEWRKAVELLPEKEQNDFARWSSDGLLRKTVREVLAKRDDEIGRFAKDFDQAVKLWEKFDPFARFQGRGGRPPFGGRGPGGSMRDGRFGGGPPTGDRPDDPRGTSRFRGDRQGGDGRRDGRPGNDRRDQGVRAPEGSRFDQGRE